MIEALRHTPPELLLLAVVAVALALIALGLAIHSVEHAPPPKPARPPAGRSAHAHLSAQDLARLNAFRPRARMMAGEPLAPLHWWQRIRRAWRDGYSGWIIACLAGSFSMATHFGAYWLIVDGGWPGAIAITLIATVVMVVACGWIGLGLISGR